MRSQHLLDQLDNLNIQEFDGALEHSHVLQDLLTIDTRSKLDLLEDDYYNYLLDAEYTDESSTRLISESVTRLPESPDTSILDVSLSGQHEYKTMRLSYNSKEPSLVRKPSIPERDSLRNYNSKAYQQDLTILQSGITSSLSILECVEDMVIQETEEIMQTLIEVINDIDASVPNNTYIVDLKFMK